MAIVAVEYKAFKPSPVEQAKLAPFQPLVTQLGDRLGLLDGPLRYGEFQLALLSLLGRQSGDDKPFTVALAGVMGAVAYEVNLLLTVPPGRRPSGDELRENLAGIVGHNIGLAAIWLEDRDRGILLRRRSRHKWSAKLMQAYNRLHPERVDITALVAGASFSLRTSDGSKIIALVRNPAKGVVDLWQAPAVDWREGIPTRIGSIMPGAVEPTWDIAQQGAELALMSFNTGRSCFSHSTIMLIQVA